MSKKYPRAVKDMRKFLRSYCKDRKVTSEKELGGIAQGYLAGYKKACWDLSLFCLVCMTNPVQPQPISEVKKMLESMEEGLYDQDLY